MTQGRLASPDSQAGTECASQGAFLLRPHRTARQRPVVLALNDAQLALVMTGAGSLPVEKRSVFLERVAARLQLRGLHFTRCRTRRRDTARTDGLNPVSGVDDVLV